MKREIKGPDDPNSSTVQYVKISPHSATPKIYLADRGSQHLTFEVTFSLLRTVTTYVVNSRTKGKKSPPYLDQHMILVLSEVYILRMSQDSLLGICSDRATGWRVGNRDSISRNRNTYICCTKRTDRLWIPPSLQFNAYR